MARAEVCTACEVRAALSSGRWPGIVYAQQARGEETALFGRYAAAQRRWREAIEYTSLLNMARSAHERWRHAMKCRRRGDRVRAMRVHAAKNYSIMLTGALFAGASNAGGFAAREARRTLSTNNVVMMPTMSTAFSRIVLRVTCERTPGC